MLTTSALRAIIDGLVDAGQLDEVQVHLFKTPITLGPGVVVGDFDEADYTGYAALVCLKAGGVYDDAAGNGVLSFVGAHFQPSGTTVGNTIFGWWAEGNISGALNNEIVAMGTFDDPIPMNGPVDALDLVVLLKVGQPADA